MPFTRTSPLVFAIAAAFGCSGSPPAPAPASTGETASPQTHVDGSLVGGSTRRVTALSHQVTGGLEVAIVDADLDCGRLASANWASQLPSGTFVLRLQLAGATATTYEVGDKAQAGWSLVTSPEQHATAGNVTLAKVSADSISGSFQLTFDSGDASGAFAAIVCED